MVSSPKPNHDSVVKRFEADARTLVPVSDEIGGTVLYLNGRPAYYVLNGEWFEAVQDKPDREDRLDDDVRDPTPSGVVGLLIDEIVSTS